MQFMQGHPNEKYFASLRSVSPFQSARSASNVRLVALARTGSLLLLLGIFFATVTIVSVPAAAQRTILQGERESTQPPSITTLRHAHASLYSTTELRVRQIEKTPATSAQNGAEVSHRTQKPSPPAMASSAMTALRSAKRRPPKSLAKSTRVPTITAAPASQTVANPVANITPSPDFLQSGECTSAYGVSSCVNPCVTNTLGWPSYNDDPGCTNYVLAAINSARADEGLVAMVLPTNWYSLDQEEQLFVVANLERTARGLPPYVGINAALSTDAQHAAATNSDPTLASGFAVGKDSQGEPGMGGAWAGGFSVLTADYMWMYDDGWGGSVAATSNVACTSSSAAGCWAHRDELLGSDPGFDPGVGLNCTDCEMGTGYALVGGSSSFVDVIEVPKAAPPTMTFTWSYELAEGFSTAE